MTLLYRLRSMVAWLVRRDRFEQQLDQELQSFVDLATAAKVREGMEPTEARRLAVIELGGAEQVKEQVRARRHGGWLDGAARDARYALRSLRQQLTFSVVVVMTLGLGIGANTAIFTLIDALMLRWLPVPSPQELLTLEMHLPTDQGSASESVSYALARAVAEQKDIFRNAAGFSGYQFIVGRGDDIARLSGALVTGGYYDTLELTPAAGRLLAPVDDEPGAAPALVISDRYWQRQFQRNPAAIGSSLIVNGTAVPIVGVSPAGFDGANVGQTADITMTVAAASTINRMVAEISGPGNFWLRVMARPAAGVSNTQAAAQFATVWSRIADSVIAPHWPAGRRKAFAEARFALAAGGTGWTTLRRAYQQPLLVLMAAVAMVLMVACANVASLMLARGSSRRREIAVRIAIGAGRGRIIGQALVESLVLVFIGAAVGVALSAIVSRGLVTLIAGDSSSVVFDVTPNLHVLIFTALIAVVSGVMFGLIPALHLSTVDPAAVLSGGARASDKPSRWLPALIAAQVAVSTLLLVGAGLFVRTFTNLQRQNPGFERAGVLLAELRERRTALAEDVVEDLRAIPGVSTVSLSTHTPLSGSTWSDVVVPKGQPLPERDTAYFAGVTAQFFETMRTPLLAGRDFTTGDNRSAQAVAIVNETFALRYFPKRSPLGEYLAANVRGERRDLAVVGVVKDISAAGLRRPPPATVYVPYRQLTVNFSTTVAIRAASSLPSVAESVRRALQRRLPDTPVEVRPLSAQVNDAMAQERMMAMLAAAFGAVALLLVCIGLYGLEAYRVAQHTREIGIRLALGATGRQVIAAVLTNAAMLVIVGVVVGLPAAWVASRSIRSMLFGLEPGDPRTLMAAILLLMAAALVAAYLPAQRAARVDPLVALRHD